MKQVIGLPDLLSDPKRNVRLANLQKWIGPDTEPRALYATAASYQTIMSCNLLLSRQFFFCKWDIRAKFSRKTKFSKKNKVQQRKNSGQIQQSRSCAACALKNRVGKSIWGGGPEGMQKQGEKEELMERRKQGKSVSKTNIESGERGGWVRNKKTGIASYKTLRSTW